MDRSAAHGKRPRLLFGKDDLAVAGILLPALAPVALARGNSKLTDHTNFQHRPRACAWRAAVRAKRDRSRGSSASQRYRQLLLACGDRPDHVVGAAVSHL